MKKKKNIFKGRNISSKLLFIIIFVIGVAAGGYFYYQSRVIPQLDEEHLVTKLPPDVANVLGAGIGQHITGAISTKVPILLYHYVEYVKDKNDTTRISLNILPNVLASQIETLKVDGYSFITPGDVINALDKGEKLPSKSIILTFDDGYMDFYTDVFPILKKEQVKAVAYIVPNFLNHPNYMFTFQLQEIAKSPYVEIGAHTMDHLSLAGMKKEKAQYEIAESRKVLQNMLKLPINSFAYPYGSFDQQAIKLVKEAGFTNAVSTVPGIQDTADNVNFLFRLRPGGRTGQALLSYLKQDSFQPW